MSDVEYRDLWSEVESWLADATPGEVVLVLVTPSELDRRGVTIVTAANGYEGPATWLLGDRMLVTQATVDACIARLEAQSGAAEFGRRAES